MLKTKMSPQRKWNLKHKKLIKIDNHKYYLRHRKLIIEKNTKYQRRKGLIK